MRTLIVVSLLVTASAVSLPVASAEAALTKAKAARLVKRQVRDTSGYGFKRIFAKCHRLTERRFACQYDAFTYTHAWFVGTGRVKHYRYGNDVHVSRPRCKMYC